MALSFAVLVEVAGGEGLRGREGPKENKVKTEFLFPPAPVAGRGVSSVSRGIRHVQEERMGVLGERIVQEE
jgi:hypothetical protein